MDIDRSTPDGQRPLIPGPFPIPPDRAADRFDLALLRLYLELRRGMEAFQEVYGLAPAGAPAGSSAGEGDGTAESFLRRLADPTTAPAARRELEEGIQQVKLHYAALLAAYQEATQDGSRRLLETVDPERLRREFEGEKIRVGPLTVPCRWKPLLTQAIWEEMLARFRRYRSLESADFERFFREGFRQGYRRFLDERSRRPAGQNSVDS